MSNAAEKYWIREGLGDGIMRETRYVEGGYLPFLPGLLAAPIPRVSVRSSYFGHVCLFIRFTQVGWSKITNIQEPLMTQPPKAPGMWMVRECYHRRVSRPPLARRGRQGMSESSRQMP